MVSIFSFLMLIYYSSLFTLFLTFYVFKSIFQINSNSPKIIYQSLIRQYVPKYIIYLIVLQFIGMVPSVMFYIKYCLLTNAPTIKYTYGVIFLVLNLLVSVFFYLQFFKKWNTLTAQECRHVSFFRDVDKSEDFNDYQYENDEDWKKRYALVLVIFIFLFLNFLAPFYYSDVFYVIYAALT